MRSSTHRAASCSSWPSYGGCPTGRTWTRSSSPTAKRPPEPGEQGTALSDAATERERPLDIVADRPRRLLIIQWADGHGSAYDFEYLRWRCPCAECAGEAGLPGRLQSTTALTDDQVTLTDMEAVGLFGLRPTWKDGHTTGIYGLALLRAICPCPECSALRAPARG